MIPADEDSGGNRNFLADAFSKDNNPQQFSELCELLDATPLGLLRFDSQNDDGVRGVYLNRPVKAGDILLRLPLDSCLVDQRPPKWLSSEVSGNPDKWATRLAASWIDLYLKQESNQESSDGIALWMSLLPDQLLKASLPVHWPEETVQNARSTSLEIAVDSAYFTRAEAVQDLVESLEEHEEGKAVLKSIETMQKIAHRALDIVQTRSCRLDLKSSNDDGDNNDICRVLAPGFDFINHGARCDDARFQDDGSANALFEMENDNGKEFLVVRSLTDLNGDEEVLIDYGSSARPAWKCLMSYGFVPKYNQRTPDDNSAEVYMFGKRYDITTDTIPFEMVEAASAAGAEFDEDRSESASIEEVQLTPDIARKIAERVQEVGFFLLLEPDLDPYETFDDESEQLQETSLDPSEVLSHTLAASLRWSQHKVLLTCAKGLEEFAQEQERNS